jgi:hypothetical protein
MSNKKLLIENLLTLIWIIVVSAVIVQIYRYALPVWDRIGSFNLPLVLSSIAAGIFSGLPSVWILGDYFHKFKRPSAWSLAFILTFLPAIGKYIPGKIWVAGSFILHASNLANITVGDSMVYQIYFQILGITATVLLLLCGSLVGYQIIYSVEFLIAGAVILFSLIALIIFLGKLLDRYRIKPRTDRIFPHLAALVVQKVLRGISLVIFVSAFIDIHAYTASILLSFFIAMQIGVLAFFAPAGLGITEGVYMVTLSPVMGIENAILVAVLSRIWHTLLDALLAVLALLIKSRRLQLLTET